MFRDSPCFFCHTSRKRLKIKEKVGARHLTHEQRSDTMRGSTKGCQVHFPNLYAQNVHSWFSSSGRLMSVCSRIGSHKMLYLVVCSDISSSLRVPIHKKRCHHLASLQRDHHSLIT